MIYLVRSARRQGLPFRLSSLALLLVAASAVLAAVLLWQGIRKLCDFCDRYSRYDALILEAGRRNGVDPRLLKAVIWRESRFRPDARGTKGEIGLMQIMPKASAQDWADAQGVKLPSRGALADPALNIEIGSWYLGRALWKWRGYKDHVVLALAEYNAGPRNARAWKPQTPEGSALDKISIASTLSYVKSILGKYETYKKTWKMDQKE